MNPSLRNLFMKWLTRDRVVPYHFGERLLADLRDNRLRFPLLTEIRHDEEQSCQPLFARIEKLIDQILFYAGISGQEVRNISENARSSWSTRTMVVLSIRMTTHFVIATTVARRSGWPDRHPSPKKSPSA